MRILFALSFLLLSACGSAGSSGPGTASPTAVADPTQTVTDHIYRYDVSGSGMTFAMDILVNLGDIDQHEMGLVGPTFEYTLPDANIAAYTPPGGRNTLASFAVKAGVGTLTVTRYRDGDVVDTQSNSVVGTSITFGLIN